MASKNANNSATRRGTKRAASAKPGTLDVDGVFVVQGETNTNVVSPGKSDTENVTSTVKGDSSENAIVADKKKPGKDEAKKDDTATNNHEQGSMGQDDDDDDVFANLDMSKKDIEGSIAKKHKTGGKNNNEASTGKPYLQVLTMDVPENSDAELCGLMFRMMDKRDGPYWCWKHNIVIQALQIMSESSTPNHYTSYFADLKPVAIRAVPHGPNEQLIITAKSNEYQIPVYGIGVFLKPDPFDKTFATARDKFIQHVRNAMKSKSFMTVFLAVSEKLMSEKFNRTLKMSNQLFFAHAKLAQIHHLPNDSLDGMLLDQDVAGWMTTCFKNFNPNGAPEHIIKVGWRDGVIPEECVTMLEMNQN